MTKKANSSPITTTCQLKALENTHNFEQIFSAVIIPKATYFFFHSVCSAQVLLQVFYFLHHHFHLFFLISDLTGKFLFL